MLVRKYAACGNLATNHDSRISSCRESLSQKETAGSAPPRPARRNACPGTETAPGRFPAPLIARCGLSASGFGDADIAGHLILGDGVDNQFQRAAIVALMEEDRFVNRQILLFDARIIHD